MNESNLRHWDRLFRTDPKVAKDFVSPGGFRGTSTAPTWTYLQLTEHFGPIGIGWGTKEPIFRVIESSSDPDRIMVFCTVCCWYLDKETNERAELWGNGGDRIIKKDQRGIFPDDDSFKKALTDAIGNAFSRLGAGADIRLGLFKDSKYMIATAEHFRNQKSLEIKPQSPMEGESSADKSTNGMKP